MKINFKKFFKKIDGSDDTIKINEYWGEFLFNEQSRTQLNVVKLHSWAVKLFNDGYLDLDKEEIKIFQDYISNKEIEEMKVVETNSGLTAVPTGKKLFLPSNRIAQTLECIREAQTSE